MKAEIREQVEIPEGVTVRYENSVFTASGPQGDISKELKHPDIKITAGETVTLHVKVATQREKRHLYTMRSHIRNLLQGAKEGYEYKLKICSGHFPMNVSLSDNKLTVKNFLGEAVPRVLKLKAGAEVKMDGDIITVKAASKETAGQQAADIEQLTRITNRDRRIFQDGIYITEKHGKVIQ